MSVFDAVAILIAIAIVGSILAPFIRSRWQVHQVRRQIAAICSETKRSVRSEAEGPPPRTGSDAIAVYRKMGYEALAEQLEKKALPCICLVSMRPKSGASPGRSRIGGLPDLPDPHLWPRHKEKSLSFVAQVDLGEVSDVAGVDTLPREGILCFFYDVENMPWGFDPKDEGSWRVVYLENPTENLPAIEFPQDLSDDSRFREVPVKPESQISIPDPSGIFPEQELTEKQKDEIIDIYGETVEPNVPRHQLLGHPAVIQNSDIRLKCQLVSHGIYCGDPSGYRDSRARDLEPGATDWKLLLQVDSDEDAQMMWGDCGRLYFWIREQDLKERRFEKVWMILQCY